MGNVQCKTPDTVLFDEQQQQQKLFFDGTTGCFSAHAKGPGTPSFSMPVHQQPASDQRLPNTLLDPRDIIKAFIAQAEELIRRKEIEEAESAYPHLHDSVAVPPFHFEEKKEDHTQRGMATLTFEHTPSRITTVSDSTILTGNVVTPTSADRRRRYDHLQQQQMTQCQSPQQISPPEILGGKDFLSREKREMRIRMILRRLEELKRDNSHNLLLDTLGPIQCGAQPDVSITMDDDIPQRIPMGSSLVKLVQDYTSVLHLRLNPHCVRYFSNHLAQFLPPSSLSSYPDSDGIVPPPKLDKVRPLRSEASTASLYPYDKDPLEFGRGPPSTPIYILATGSVFLDLAVTGCLGLANRRNIAPFDIYGDRLEPPFLLQQQAVPSPSHYLVLMNRRSGAPIAVAALKKDSSTGSPIARLFATKKRLLTQRQAATTRQLGLDWWQDVTTLLSEPESNNSSSTLPLYTWAELVTQGRYPGRVKYSMFLATGSDGHFEAVPRYTAIHESSTSPEIQVLGRTDDRLGHRQPVAVLSLCAGRNSEDDEDSSKSTSSDIFFRISVARGMDPALMIVFCSMVDEMLELSMQTQLQHAQEQVCHRSQQLY